jgi:signal transduction histidine kinase
MLTRNSLSLRSRFLLLVLLGAVIPLGLMGYWLSRSARQSGERLVRERLEASLLEIVNSVGSQWGGHRSALLDVAEHPVVVAALRAGRGLRETSDVAGLQALDRAWSAAAGVAAEATVRDRGDEVVGRLPLLEEREEASPGAGGIAPLPQSIVIRDPRSGEELGTLEVMLRTERLLPPGVMISGVGGAMLVLFDDRSGTPLAPLPLEAESFGRPRFTYMGDDWITVVRRLREPPLRFVLAGPVGSMTRPFEEAARRGTLALLVVAVVAFGLATLLTRRFTRSLHQLADAAESVSHGDLSRRAEEEGPPEIKGMARAFNSMTESLSRTLQKLTQREAAAAVGEFAASLAHEVRNPLTSVSMDLQLTRHKVDDHPEARELVDRALSEIERLNESVGGFLQIARSGQARPSRVDLRVPLDAAVRAARPRFDERETRLEYSSSEAPVWVTADGGAIEQLVLNLLLNAADSLEPGGRAGLTVELSNGVAEVRVWDEGRGIVAEDLARIFDAFYSTKDEGTGLGLAVAQRIARAHGSELRVESEVGVGTTFRFLLPLEPAGEDGSTVTNPRGES